LPKRVPRAQELTPEQRRERRQLRREKQRESNALRAEKMHAARLKMEVTGLKAAAAPRASLFIGCSGWRYWDWRTSFYAEVPQPNWFEHYAKAFDTVEINASFYSWPTMANVQAWQRGLGKKRFVYTVKVCELITHVKKFKSTKTLVKDFGMIADVLGARMGCFLFQLPPSYRFTKVRLRDIVTQLDLSRRNVVETPAGGTRRSTAPSARPESSFAPAAHRDYRTNLFARRMRSMFASTVPNDGIGTITPMKSSPTGRPG
jgi:uncharacterized protein YecE (DUF72 family)